MSDPSETLQNCPNCGQENSIHSLKCIRCGEMLEGLFAFDDLKESEDALSDETQEQDTIATVLSSLEDNALLTESLTAEDVSNEEEGPREDPDSDLVGRERLPEWLERVRQRAKEEEAGGEMAKGARAMDAQRAGDGRSQVDQAFDGMLKRIREQSELERKKTRRGEENLVDENGDPEWLRRIRELHPRQDEDTQQLHTEPAPSDALDDDWTEEELQELLRREIGAQLLEEQNDGFDGEELTPSPTEEESPASFEKEADPLTDLPQEELEGFHVIAEDEADLLPGFMPSEPPEPEELDLSETDLPDMDDAERSTLENANELNDAPLDDTPPETEADEEVEFEEQSEQEDLEEAIEVAPDSKEPDLPTDHGTVEQKEALGLTSSEDDPDQAEEVLPDLLYLRDQRDRAQVMSNIIEQEGRRTIPLLHERTRQGKLGRLILALLLIAGIVGALLLGPAQRLDLPESLPGIAFNENFESLESGQTLMIILDYQAATSFEIEGLAKPLLEELNNKGVSVAVFTAQPKDLWLGRPLFEGVAWQNILKNIQFIPGGVLGYLTLAAGTSPTWGKTPLEASLLDGGASFGQSDQVLIISDSFEMVRVWLEQISPWQGAKPLFVITTETNRALLLPYFDSGQIDGFLAGQVDGTGTSPNQRAWQVGMFLLLIVLILGMISKADADATRREERRNV